MCSEFSKRFVRVAMSLTVAAVIAAIGCKGSEPKPEAEKKEVKSESEKQPDSVALTPQAIQEAGIKTWTAAPVALGNTLTLNGTVAYDENHLLVIAPPVSGRVVQIPVDLGQRVSKGQPVAWIESVELSRARQEYVRALTEFEIAQKSYERAKLLVAEKAISAGEFQQREGDYLGKRAAVTTAEGALRQVGDDPAAARQQSSAAVPRVALRAPFAGHVVDRKVTPGALVEALHPILTVADLSTVWCFFNVYDKDLAAIRTGLPISVTADAFPGEVLKGSVNFVGSEVDPATRTVRIRATVRNPGLRLGPGLFVKGRIEVPRTAANSQVMAVPKGALQTLEGRTTIFVRLDATKFARRFVETGPTFDEYVQILSGLRSGEQVVVNGSFVMKSEFSKASLKEEE